MLLNLLFALFIRQPLSVAWKRVVKHIKATLNMADALYDLSLGNADKKRHFKCLHVGLNLFELVFKIHYHV